MIRAFHCHAVKSALLTTLAALALASSPARAQVAKPFEIAGIGVAPKGLPLPGQAPRPHWIVGVATDLGFHYGYGTVETESAAPQPNGTITGAFGSGSPFDFIGANGDRLVCEYGQPAFGAGEPGSFTLTIHGVLPGGLLLVSAAFVAEFVPQPALCTGKFAGATGSWIMYAYTAPFILGSSAPIDYWWEGEGTLTLKQGN